MKRRYLQAAAVILLLVLSGIVHAHRVTIFAWIEGQTVHTVSKFPGGKKVAGSSLRVYDEAGNRLLEGKTDADGSFSFKIPKHSALNIVLEAGTGHQAEWRLTKQEVGEALGKEVNSSPSADSEGGSEKTEGTANHQSRQRLEEKEISTAEIQSIVEKTLDRKMAPMMQMLVDMHDPGPSVSEILGGIGYIIGLFGIAFYVSARRKIGRP